MRISTAFLMLLTFLAAAGLSLLASGFLVTAVQDQTEITVRDALDKRGFDWAEVEADGLRVVLAGLAPDEAGRFAAVGEVGEVVDSARIIDEIEVAPSGDPTPPRFSVELLRNQSGVSAIGLIPAESDRDALIAALTKVAGDAPVSDLLQEADYPVPDGWDDALGFTVEALSHLPRSKISVDADKVAITAIAASPEAKRKLEQELRRTVPPGLEVTLDIAAPRPVITPFSLRYIIDDAGGRFDSCSADTETTRARILKAAEAAGGGGGAPCRIGLGVPSPDWAEAVAAGLAGLRELGGGSITFADADVTLVAADGTDPGQFDKVVGELEAALPPVFALHPVLPVQEGKDTGPKEFIATLSPEGLVQLRGRLNDENLQRMADAYAKARFGSASVYSAARTAPDLPANWPVRVLAGIEALSRLSNGAVTVTPDKVVVRGTATREDARAEISGLLSDRLGEAESFTLDVAYKAPPPPKDEVKTPEVCESDIAEVQRSRGKITFEPGSATISAGSLDTMDAIADILAECGDIRLEIQGHTDSQGRTSMNQQLSQQRAQSVLNELRARRVLTSSYVAKGYGESAPIASNDTEEGREANRRIEFRLIMPEPTKDHETTLEQVAEETPMVDPDEPDDKAGTVDAAKPDGSGSGGTTDAEGADK